jgi:hypothetical protein
MTIYFSANCRNLEHDKPLYKRIIDVALKEGWSVNNNWLEAAEWRMSSVEAWGGICHEAMTGISLADALIVEASDRSAFGVGYEVAVALQRGLPVLLLCEKGSSSYASGLRHPLIYYREYDTDTLDKLVERFLADVKREGR